MISYGLPHYAQRRRCVLEVSRRQDSVSLFTSEAEYVASS
jgi:hypothetical protein